MKVFMFALVLGSGTARRLESILTDANEPIGIGSLKPGRRTATLGFHADPRLLFLYDVEGAMREPAAASHFVEVCAESLTGVAPE